MKNIVYSLKTGITALLTAGAIFYTSCTKELAPSYREVNIPCVEGLLTSDARPKILLVPIDTNLDFKADKYISIKKNSKQAKTLLKFCKDKDTKYILGELGKKNSKYKLKKVSVLN